MFCLQVRRWMRNPKVNVEKVQAKGFLSPCPKCQEGQDLWYTHFPAPYGCCHYSPGGYYLPHPPSPLCQPCAPCTPCQPDKNKTCKVRKLSVCLLTFRSSVNYLFMHIFMLRSDSEHSILSIS